MEFMVYVEREIEKSISEWIDEREIVIIRGARQCGKTTIMKKTLESLKSRGISEQQLSFLTFEDDIIRLKFEENPVEFIKAYQLSEKKHYFFLDEVQYIDNVGKKLKLIFDSIDNVKLIVSGSSSFDLTSLGKYLVGRAIFLDMRPFSFLEFLRAKNKQHEKAYSEHRINFDKPDIKKYIFLDNLNSLLKEYLTFGSYPRIVLEENKERKKELLKNLFLTYIEKDIVSLYGNEYRDNAIKVLKVLSLTKGIIKYESISQDSGVSVKEIKEILPLLEDSFAISIIKPFYKNILNELRKNPKIYFIDCGLRNYISGQLDIPNFDILYENFACNQLKPLHDVKYWRTTAKTEVDFIIDDKIPVEVKTAAKIPRSLRGFIESYNPQHAFVANLSGVSKSIIKNCKVFLFPLAYL